MSKILKLTNVFVFITLWLILGLLFIVVNNNNSVKPDNTNDSLILDKLTYLIELEEEQNETLYELDNKVDSTTNQLLKLDKIQNKRLYLLEAIQY